MTVFEFTHRAYSGENSRYEEWDDEYTWTIKKQMEVKAGKDNTKAYQNEWANNLRWLEKIGGGRIA